VGTTLSVAAWPLTCPIFFFRSFALALHAFCLLFLRTRPTTRSKWIALALGWTFVVFIVTIGPLAIQKEALGPYFGPSGFWYVPRHLSQPAANLCQRCWITEQYPAEQTFLEYLPVSAVYKRQNTLLVSMLTVLPSFALRSGCPRCLASCFTSLSFFAFEGTSYRTPRENGSFNGSHVAKAGGSAL